ncbi:MAG TPA: MraY family glycosyltransferase [Candidatus Dormibacteraeota bacterium]
MSGTVPWLPALPPFLVASIVCIAGVPLSMALARRTGAVAEPDADRHIHAQPTPRLGGIAMFLGFAIAVAIFGESIAYRWQVVAVCAAITAAMAIDDIFDLSWRTKLFIEAGAGVLVAATGVLITFVAVPGLGHTTVWQLGWLAAPVTVAWITGMEVSVNFLDGADGVAAGVVAIVAAVMLLAAINRLESPGDVQSGVIVMSGAIMGCCLGFLVFNLPPARVFMGDAGSHFLGVALGMLTILGVAKIVVGLSLLVPLIALGLPISDTAYAIVRRRRAGRSAATPDAGHLHHRLLARGMTPLETALTFYLATGILGCIALTIYGHRKILDAALALLVVALAALVWRSRRRRPGSVIVHDEEFDLPGHTAVRSRLHSGEVD